MLKSSSDTDITVRITIHEQDLDLANRASEDRVDRRVVNGLVTSQDGGVGSRIRRILVSGR